LALLVISLLGGMDDLFVADLLPRNTFTDPAYFVGTAAGYLALGVVALFTVVPERERSYVAPIVPIYMLYALVHVVPMTVGFGNFIALRLWGRRLYRDHYELEAGTAGAPLVPALAGKSC
jgi:hypothetical protein